jgi:restriction system protein
MNFDVISTIQLAHLPLSAPPPVALGALSGALHGTKARAVRLSGEAGTGKTCTALYFAHHNSASFPGGVFGAVMPPVPGALRKVAASTLADGSGAKLLIIDDVDEQQHEDFDSEIFGILNDHPELRILVTSRRMGVNSPVVREVARLFDIEGVSATRQAFRLPELLQLCRGLAAAGVLNQKGEPISTPIGSTWALNEVRNTSVRLLTDLARKPELLHRLSPREFEEVVAEILTKQGFDVTLTRFVRDGGKDIYAARRNELGTFLYLVECKKYSPDHLVSVDLVRTLYGVVEFERATAGILVTTSSFTKDAREFARTIECRMALKDFLDVKTWLHGLGY